MVKSTLIRYSEIIDYLDGHNADVVNLSIGLNAESLEIALSEYLSPNDW